MGNNQERQRNRPRTPVSMDSTQRSLVLRYAGAYEQVLASNQNRSAGEADLILAALLQTPNSSLKWRSLVPCVAIKAFGV